MGTRETLAIEKRICAELRREPHFEKEPPSIREALASLEKRMCAALRREPHFENDPPSIRENFAVFGNECARR
eukprot:8449146-Pyramimonas_sp.AAC.1